VRAHDHTYHEICLILTGSFTHVTDAGQHRLGAGSVVVVPPTAVHAMKGVEQISVVNVYYLAEWIATDLSTLWEEPGLVPMFLSESLIGPAANPGIAEFGLNDAEVATTTRDLRDIDEESALESPSSVVIRGAFLKVLARLARASRRALPAWGGLRAEIWAAIRHIERLVQLGHRLEMGALAESLSLSPTYLGRLFATAVGRSPIDYFQLRRVHRACQQLREANRSITEIALELGYSDTPHFCRMFHRYQNMTPRQYRQTFGVGGS
jgi:AraC-like DNA-binding protein